MLPLFSWYWSEVYIDEEETVADEPEDVEEEQVEDEEEEKDEVAEALVKEE